MATSLHESENRPRRLKLRYRGLEFLLLVVGLIPIVGYVMGGAFNPVEAGVGTVFVIFAVYHLVRRT